MPTSRSHGTLDLLVLKTFGHGPRHGCGIARYLEVATGETLAIAEGSLHPALYRLRTAGSSTPRGAVLLV